MKIAVITGASSGLGREFVLQLDKIRSDIDCFWLIARRDERLRELASELRHDAKILPLDLSLPVSITRFCHELEEASQVSQFDTIAVEAGVRNTLPKFQIALFVNCAGFGKIGNYNKISSEDVSGMIDLNCRAAVSMTNAVIPYMTADSGIIQICSTAAFQPLQYINVYGASKVFLLHYTRGLRWELKGTGIKVTAVCPYWMKQTEFIKTATAGQEKGNEIANFHFGDNPEKVVARAIAGNARNRAVVTPGVLCSMHRVFSKFFPLGFLQAVWEIWRKL